MKIILQLILASCIAVLLGACAHSSGVIKTYSGEPDSSLVATVVVPESIDVKAINEESFNRLLKVGETVYAFTPGEYKVTLQYTTLWNISSDEHEVVKSKVIEQTWQLQAGAEYRLKTETADDLEAAREVAKSFQPWLVMEKIGVNAEDIPEQVSKTLPDSQVVQELKRWWQKANAMDKDRFREFIKQEK